MGDPTKSKSVENQGPKVGLCRNTELREQRCTVWTAMPWVAAATFLVAFMLGHQELFVSGIFLLFGLIVFLLGVPVFIYRVGRLGKGNVFHIKLLLWIYLVGILGILCGLLPNLYLRRAVLLFPTLASLLLIIINVAALRHKQLDNRLFVVKFICLLAMPLVLLSPTVLSFTLRYVYTPPAIMPENLKVYNECIRFVREYGEYKNLTLWRGLLFNGENQIDTQSLLHESYLCDMHGLFKHLYEVKCIQFKRDNDMLVFYKNANYILPVGAGVLYSLSGENPNEIDSQVLNRAKPFTNIADRWYMSRHLMLGGTRTAKRISIPASLVDHSLRIEGLDLGATLNKPSVVQTGG